MDDQFSSLRRSSLLLVAPNLTADQLEELDKLLVERTEHLCIELLKPVEFRHIPLESFTVLAAMYLNANLTAMLHGKGAK